VRASLGLGSADLPGYRDPPTYSSPVYTHTNGRFR